MNRCLCAAVRLGFLTLRLRPCQIRSRVDAHTLPTSLQPKKLERTGWTDAHGNGRGQRRIRHTCLQLAGVRVLRLLSACTGRGSACTDARMETGSLQGR